MSGPYCKTCKFFVDRPLVPRDFDECGDPSKIIYDRNGNPRNDAPEVHDQYTCSNWSEPTNDAEPGGAHQGGA